MKGKGKILKKLIFPLICLILVIVMVLSMNDIDDILSVLKNVKPLYLLYAFLVLALYFALWPISLFVFTKSRKLKIKFLDVFLIGSTEHFFNGVTPFATGGQPFQAYFFKKKGINYSDSTGILLLNYIIYQAVITIMFVVAFIINYDYLKQNVSNVFWLMILGIIINVFVLLVFISLGCLKKVRQLLLSFLKLLSKIKFLRKTLERKIPSFEHYCDEYQEAFKYMAKNKISILLAAIIKTLTMFVYYSVPFYVLKAVGVQVDYNQFFFIVSMTCFSICMTCWIPTPGASGGIELAFKTLFASIAGVTATIAVSGMLVWRLITYYILMIISFIAFIVFESLNKKNSIFDLDKIESDELNEELEISDENN